MKSMQLPLAAIFFMTYFNRAGGGHGHLGPPTGSATVVSIHKVSGLCVYCIARCCQLVLHRCHWLVYWCHGNSSSKTRHRTWRRNAQEGALGIWTDCLETYCAHSVTISISIVWREFMVSNLSVLRKENNIWVSYQKSTIVTNCHY